MDDTNELVKYAKAFLALQLQAASPGEERVKPEILLTRAGLAAREIADLLGRSRPRW